MSGLSADVSNPARPNERKNGPRASATVRDTVSFGSLANEGGGDRAIRIVAGIAMFCLGWFVALPWIWSVTLKIFCWHFLISGIVGWSPLYALFGLSTRRSRS